MKPEELRGRELAAWLLGRAELLDDLIKAGAFRYVGGALQYRLAAAEIERLCAESKVNADLCALDKRRLELEHDLGHVSEAAARDAAALDEIATFLRPCPIDFNRHEDPNDRCWNEPVAFSSNRKTTAKLIAAIIERTGRKIGGGT